MSDLLERLRKAARSAQEQEHAGRFVAGGKIVVCPQCGGDRFDEGRVPLGSGARALEDQGAGDGKVSILTCRRCGRIEWFTRPPDALRPTNPG